MRIVIGLGDTATQDGDFIGEVLALIARIEAITPPERDLSHYGRLPRVDAIGDTDGYGR